MATRVGGRRRFSCASPRCDRRVVAATDNDATVAIFCHGGVINIVLQELLGLERPLTFPIEYVSVTRILVSRNGSRRVGSINETGHVRNMLRV